MPQTRSADSKPRSESLSSSPVAWVAFATDASESRAVCLTRQEAETVSRKHGWGVAPLYAARLTEEERSVASDGSAGCPYVTGTVTRYCTLTPLSLTSEEREAVNYFAEWGVWPAARLHAAALRGLLERTR